MEEWLTSVVENLLDRPELVVAPLGLLVVLARFRVLRRRSVKLLVELDARDQEKSDSSSSKRQRAQ